ncbi:hypothetical protein [Streptomyces sp. NPDC015125]|uniref:hypothetical protein n=1 Tax=Streptomyces sp. NPDC015125 TaxID=3364938 RepID=UPI0037035CE1
MSENNQPLTAASRAAAEWWGEQVRTVKAETDGLHPGLSTEQAFVATAQIAMRDQAIAQAPADDATVDAFVAELTQLITASELSVVTLSVDYGPSGELARAAEAARLHKSRFPLKTTAKVWPDHVLAKAGYGAPWRVVWSAPSWEHPPCEAQEWPEDSDDPIGPKCGRPQWHDGAHDWQQGRRP